MLIVRNSKNTILKLLHIQKIDNYIMTIHQQFIKHTKGIYGINQIRSRNVRGVQDA